MEPLVALPEREREEDAREKNRTTVVKRSRQWETVASDDGSQSQSRDYKGSSSENSMGSDSEASIGSRRKVDKKSKKNSKKHKSNKLKKSKKEKKEKKEKHKKKKSKKSKHSDDDSESESNNRQTGSVAVDQNQFGKYGVIRESNFFHKQREFEAYMSEVKNMPGVLSGSKREVMELFKQYIEDYNTATLPMKYYDLDKWEMNEYKQKQQKALQAKHDDHESTSSSSFMLKDEDDRRAELRREREREEQRRFAELKAQMAIDKGLTESMKRQSELQTQLQIAYKKGDTQTVKRLERLLAPDEVTTAVKHPWA